MRRLIDVLVSTVALLILSPLLLAIALALMIDSAGGPFYLSRRIGQGGRPFRMWKFRTMRAGADQGSCITVRNDARITRLGALLRKSKLDELPQFTNVLLGDMTLVGPRPESPEIVALYTPAQQMVLEAKPGVTGPVQLEAGDESDTIPAVDAQEYYVNELMGRKLRQDLEYLRTRTPLTDARIVAQTGIYVLRAIGRRI